MNAMGNMKDLARRTLLVAMAISGAWVHCGTAVMAQEPVPGQVIRYSMSIGPIKAGEATLTTRSTTLEGQKAYQLELTARTNKAAAKIYFMDDTLRSTVLPGIKTVSFWKHSREEERESIETATIDGNNVKLYKNRIHKGIVKTADLTSTKPVYDLVSMLMVSRTIDASKMKKGDRIQYQIIDGVELIPAFLEYNGREKIKTGGKSVECNAFTVIQPVDENGRHTEKELMKMFITADATRLPAGIDINLGFGSAKVRLIP